MDNLEVLGLRLGSGDAEERREAVMDLGRIGQTAAPFLLRAMSDADWRVRKTAVEYLVRIGGASVIEGLLDALNATDNAGARNSAIEALVQIGRSAVEVLLRQAENPDPDVRKFIVDILGDIRDPGAVPKLVEHLSDEDENIRVASAEALGKIRDRRAVPPLLAALERGGSGWLAYASVDALGEIGDERALSPILGALGNAGLREPILEALGKMGNATTLAPLVASLADPLRIVREVAITAIAAIYRKSAMLARQKVIATVRSTISNVAVDSLEDILMNSTGELQKATIAILGWTGRESSIRKLLTLVREEELAESVAQSLKYLGRENAELIFEHLTSDNSLVRRTAAEVLGELGIPSADEALIPLLRDENGHVRSTAAEALGRLGSVRSAKALVSLLEDEYESVQETAIRAIAAIGDASVISGLITSFSSHATTMRRNIALLLGHFSHEQAIDALAFAMKDEEPAVRKAAVQALGNAAGGKALRSLLLAITDDNPDVRILAAESLGKIGTLDARDALFPLLGDQDLWVRATAVRGLGQIGGDMVVNALAGCLQTASDIFLLALLDVLGKLHPAAVLGAIVSFTEHFDPEVRKTAVIALGGYGPSVQGTIAARLTDSHWSVRKAAVESLGRQRSADIDAQLSRLAVEDPDSAVRYAAGEALGR